MFLVSEGQASKPGDLLKVSAVSQIDVNCTKKIIFNFLSSFGLLYDLSIYWPSDHCEW